MTNKLPDQARDEFEKPNSTLVFRGVAEHNRERAGKWWSTDPYYALFYAKGGKGVLFVADVDNGYLQSHGNDASIDEGYENYTFPHIDPPGMRVATPEEIQELKDARPKPPAGEEPLFPGMVIHPENAVELGIKIFRGNAGSIALPQVVTVEPAQDK